MHVQLVTAATSGGAGRAARRLQNALNQTGVRTDMSVQRNPDTQSSLLGGFPVPWWVSPAASRLVTRLSGTRSIRSINYLPTGRLASINQGNADLVNLHWLGSDTLSIKEIGGITKPCVWTFHDMWAFCGTEHIAPDSMESRWRLGYPPLAERGFDLDARIWKRKQRYFPKHGFAVCPSNWLATCTKQSALLSKWTVKTIPNPLDTELFAPMPKTQARAQLGLSGDEHIVLFGAHGADTDSNKGFDLLNEMMGRLSAIETSKPIRCLIFGNTKPGPDAFNNLPATYLGRLDNDRAIVLAYAAADLVIVPSRQENMPQVATEAQSCGRPVVAFSTTGLVDAVKDGETGLLVPPFDTVRGATMIAEVLEQPSTLQRFGEVARQRAIREWSPQVIAAAYLAYFEEVIAHSR
jgi:glycosyltransferase involved in cell wall biosynthesis